MLVLDELQVHQRWEVQKEELKKTGKRLTILVDM